MLPTVLKRRPSLRLLSASSSKSMTKSNNIEKSSVDVEIDGITAASFLDKYHALYGGSRPLEERQQLSPQGPFRIKLTQALTPGTTVVDDRMVLAAEGQANSAKDARNLARVSLVKQMFGLLKLPHEYLPKPARNKLFPISSTTKPAKTTKKSVKSTSNVLFPNQANDSKLMPVSIKLTSLELKKQQRENKKAEAALNEEKKRTKTLRDRKLKQARDKETILTTSAKLKEETLQLREQVTELSMELDTIDLPRQEDSTNQAENMEYLKFQDRSHFVNALEVEKFTNLPIRAYSEEILRTIERNQVTVISAATGSGKTTQVPQYVMELYRRNSSKAQIIVTQPRRIAAISIAKRIATEMNESLGQSVGYSVRFDNRLASGSSTVNMVTAGILLKMLQSDPLLRRATHLILDEVHERDLFTDTLLLIIKQRLLEKRPDLKVILMSATMSSERLVKYFESSVKVGKVLDIAGTNFPITKYFLEDVKEMCPGAEEDPETREYYEADSLETTSSSVRIEKGLKGGRLVPHNLIARLIAQIDGREGEGGILVFLPGWEEMMNVMKHLAGRIGPNSSYRVYLLHSTGSVQCDLSTGLPLPEEETMDVFTRCPPGVRKIVLATNIAESSVTIPDIVHVIDSGKQKMIFYDASLRINCLEMAWASKANTKQRMGRAGRCQPGKYYALMSQRRFEGLAEGVPPEIARLDLAEAALGIKASGLEGSLEGILRNACDPPEEKLVRMASKELVDLGAFREEDHSLTPLGRALARFPIHPRLSRMLLTSILMRCPDDIIATVATIGERPYKPTRTDVDKARLRNSIRALLSGNEWGDHLMLTNVLDDWKRHYFNHPALSFTGLKKMHKARMQYEKSLENALGSLSIEDGVEGVEGDLYLESDPWKSDPWKVTRFVLSTGFYPDIAVQRKKNVYWANGMPQVKLLPVSSEYESIVNDSNNSSGDDLMDIQKIFDQSGNDQSKKKRRPKFYVFEELMDTGASIKSMRRITAIDPLFLILSANKVFYSDPSSNNISNDAENENASRKMLIDDFIKIEMDPRTAGFMLELRALWRQILCIGIPLMVQGERTPAIDRAAALVRSIIIRESDIFRRNKHDSIK